MVLLRESEMTQPEIAKAMGVSLSTVTVRNRRAIARRFRLAGPRARLGRQESSAATRRMPRPFTCGGFA
jgi:DNA-directed RNA polymerase specialized sigma24 family protein